MDAPSLSTIKRLFALSSNRCAFPNCALPIFEESGALTGTVCHIKARNAGGPRYDPEQSDQDRHGFANLLILCARHSKIIDIEAKNYPIERLAALKATHESRCGVGEIIAADGWRAAALLDGYRSVYSIKAGGNVMVNSPGAVQATNVTIRSSKRSLRMTPPTGSIAASLRHRNYVKYLIDRYHEYARQQKDRSFSPAVLYKAIERKFKAKWDYIPVSEFDTLVSYLQERIDKSLIGKLNRSRGRRNFSSFEGREDKEDV